METFEYGRGRRKKGRRGRGRATEGGPLGKFSTRESADATTVRVRPSLHRAGGRARAGNGAIGSGAADASHAQFSAYSFRKRKKESRVKRRTERRRRKRAPWKWKEDGYRSGRSSESDGGDARETNGLASVASTQKLILDDDQGWLATSRRESNRRFHPSLDI